MIIFYANRGKGRDSKDETAGQDNNKTDNNWNQTGHDNSLLNKILFYYKLIFVIFDFRSQADFLASNTIQ